MVFALQKYGFWRAKRGFLHCKSMVFAMQLINENEEIVKLV